jgi:hypothetical protein
MSTPSLFYVVTGHNVTEAQRRAITHALGLSKPATRAQVRGFLERQAQLTLEALQLPLPAERQRLRESPQMDAGA